MTQTWAQLRDGSEAILQDGGISPAGTAANQLFATVELDLIMADALREIAVVKPYIARVPFTIESRTGLASTTSANNLVDTTEGQFASGDVGKVVYNTTQKTWALITTYASTSSIGLSKSIFSVNDAYRIFNKECTNNKQINISDVTDYIDIVKAQYPLGSNRLVIRDVGNPDIIELDMVREPDDSKAFTSGVQPDTEALIYFAKRHKVSQLTDLAGALSSSAIAGATTLALTALQGAGTIEADQEFTIANVRGNYWVTASTTIASSAANISFYPALQSAANTATVVTFKLSTLTPQLEPSFTKYVAGKAAINKVPYFYQQLNASISTMAAATIAIASVAGRTNAATTYVAAGSTELVKAIPLILTAATSLASMTGRLQAGTIYIAAGSTEIAKAVANILSAATALAAMSTRVAAATTYIASGSTQAVLVAPIILSAATALSSIDAKILAATVAIAAGTVELAKVPAIVLSAATAITAASTRIASATTYIASGSTQAAAASTQIASATTEIALINAQIDLAASALAAGSAIVNVVPVGGGAPEWMGQAAANVGVGRGYLTSGQGMLQSSQIDSSLSGNYLGLSGRELNAALAKISEGQGFLQQAAADVNLDAAWLNSGAGQIQLAHAYIQEAQGYLQQATADESITNTYLGLAARELQGAGAKLNEAQGLLQQGNANINLNNGYLNSAAKEIQLSGGYLTQAQGYFQQAKADESLNSSYLQSAQAQLAIGASDINEAITNMRLVASRLSVSSAGRVFEVWGRQQVQEAMKTIQLQEGVTTTTRYLRD